MGAMKSLEGSLTKLSKLPAEVGKMAATIDSPDDIAKIDVGPMKKALDVSGIKSPLDSIAALREILSTIVSVAKDGFAKLQDFISSCPDMVTKAFEVSPPLCFMTSMIMSQAPAPMKMILEKVETVKNVDMQPLMDVLDKTADSICNMDLEKVTAPVNKFAESAGG